jgi:hypothetical protein
MGITTFSGPIRAGNIANTSGTELGTNVRNVGSVIMVQHIPLTQAGTTTALGTTIVLPANSHILQIQLLATTAWTANISLGVSATATELVAATAATAVGINGLTPGTDPTRSALWDDTGTTDRRVFVLSASTGAGVGSLTIRYIQAHDLASS